MPKPITNDDLDLLAEAVAAEMDDEPWDPGVRGEAEKLKPWRPRLNPTQELAFNDPARVVGLVGPKFSGKTLTAAHKIVRHCYEEWNALYQILGVTIDALKDGVCDDLTSFVLPQWRDGNREPKFLREGRELVPNPRAGELIDNGIGLEYTLWKQDSQTKHIYLKIRNRFGGWSRAKVISIPHPQMIDERIRGPAPSGIYLEEATKCKSYDYVKLPILQLARRRDIVGPQQYVFSCNPEDPENWVHKWMYRPPVVVPDNLPGRNWPDDPEEPNIRRRLSVSFYNVPYEENAHNVSQENRQLVKEELESDPIAYERLFKGRWIAKPSGEALFKHEFVESQHMRGKAPDDKGYGGQGLLPVPGFPIILGYDYGLRSIGTSFQQIFETPDGPFIMIFDELCYHRQKIKSKRTSHALVEKIRFWNEWLREQTGKPADAWSVWHIAGDDATTTYRPNSDSVDAKNTQDETRAIIESEPDRYRGIEPFLIRGCPRPAGSISQRTDLFADAMIDERFMVSQLCPWHRKMLLNLESDPDEPSLPKKGSKWKETFDAATYPSLYRQIKLPGGFYDSGATYDVQVVA